MRSDRPYPTPGQLFLSKEPYSPALDSLHYNRPEGRPSGVVGDSPRAQTLLHDLRRHIRESALGLPEQRAELPEPALFLEVTLREIEAAFGSVFVDDDGSSQIDLATDLPLQLAKQDKLVT